MPNSTTEIVRIAVCDKKIPDVPFTFTVYTAGNVSGETLTRRVELPFCTTDVREIDVLDRVDVKSLAVEKAARVTVPLKP